MTKLQKSIVIDGERVSVDMTDSEQQEFEFLRANDQAVKDKKSADRQAVLDKLGLSADEIAILLG
jgi:hypothetical protein